MQLPPQIVWSMAAVTTVAAATDFRSRIIPNWLVLAGIVLGFGLNTYFYGTVGLKTAALGFGLALLIYVPLFILRAMGGGDVKLMAAVGSLAGPRDWMAIFIFASILGALFALGLLLARRSLGPAFSNVGHIVTNLLRGRAPYEARPELDISNPKALTMPHGIAIAAGTIFFLVLQ